MLSSVAPSNASIAERIPALMTNQFELEPPTGANSHVKEIHGTGNRRHNRRRNNDNRCNGGGEP
jgi:hypothetical protein